MSPRTKVALGLAALCLLAPFGEASAIAPAASVAAQVSPNDAGTATKPRPVEVELVHTMAFGSEAQRTTSKLSIAFPSEIAFDGPDFASCPLSVLRDNDSSTQCSDRSRVGSGRAIFRVGQTQADVTLTVFNGPKGKSMLFRLVSGAPTSFDTGISGTLVKTGVAGYGISAIIRFPEEFRSAGGVPIALTRWELDLTGRTKFVRRDGRRVQVTYVGLRRCPDRTLAFRTTAELDGLAEPRTAETSVRCDP